MHDPVKSSQVWRKSSRSPSQGANCVEVSYDDRVAIRDSKQATTADFPRLSVSASDWTGFLQRIRSDGAWSRNAI